MVVKVIFAHIRPLRAAEIGDAISPLSFTTFSHTHTHTVMMSRQSLSHWLHDEEAARKESESVERLETRLTH